MCSNRNSNLSLEKRHSKARSESGIERNEEWLTSVGFESLQAHLDLWPLVLDDFRIERLFNFMGAIDTAKNQREEVLSHAERYGGEMRDEEVRPKAMAQWLRRQGRCMRETADILKELLSTVGEWCKGMTWADSTDRQFLNQTPKMLNHACRFASVRSTRMSQQYNARKGGFGATSVASRTRRRTDTGARRAGADTTDTRTREGKGS